MATSRYKKIATLLFVAFMLPFSASAISYTIDYHYPVTITINDPECPNGGIAWGASVETNNGQFYLGTGVENTNEQTGTALTLPLTETTKTWNLTGSGANVGDVVYQLRTACADSVGVGYAGNAVYDNGYLFYGNFPILEPLPTFSTLLQTADTGFKNTTGATVGESVAWVGDSFIKIIVGSALSVLNNLKWWILALMILFLIYSFYPVSRYHD